MPRLCGQLSKNAVHLNSDKDVFCVLVSFRVRSSKEALQDRSPREHKSVLCVLRIEKQPMSSRSLESYRKVCLIRVAAKFWRTVALQDQSCPALLCSIGANLPKM